MLAHKWLASEHPHFVPDPDSPSGGPTDLLPNIHRVFNAKQTCECYTMFCAAVWRVANSLMLHDDVTVRKAVLGMMAAKRFSLTTAAASQLADDVSEYKRVAEDVSKRNHSRLFFFILLIFSFFLFRKLLARTKMFTRMLDMEKRIRAMVVQVRDLLIPSCKMNLYLIGCRKQLFRTECLFDG